MGGDNKAYAGQKRYRNFPLMMGVSDIKEKPESQGVEG